MPRYEQFRLPDAGEGLTEADIVQWLVAVGDRVQVNQPIVEIETAKSLVELPCPYGGVVTELLVEQGVTVDVGTPIITVDTDPDGTATPVDAPDAAASGGVAEAGSGEAGSGDAGSGAVLVGYGTADSGASRRARRAAPLAEAIAPPAVGTTAAVPAQSAAPEAAAATSRAALAGAQAKAQAERPDVHPVLAKPPVRKLARDLGVDLDTVTPTGPGGIVTREDVIARSKENEPRTLATYAMDDKPWLASGTVSDDGRSTRVPVRSVRKRTAEAMVSSAFSAPHVSVFHTVDVTKTMHLVERLREDREFADVRVTPLLIAAKALVLAVRRHAEINASWREEEQEIVYKHYVNLGIAAQTPRGLIVPNIKDAHRLGLHDLALALADLTARARAVRSASASARSCRPSRCASLMFGTISPRGVCAAIPRFT